MRVLIFHKINYINAKDTVFSHISSFRKYFPDDFSTTYYNCNSKIHPYLKHSKYDVVLLHYSFLAERFNTTKKQWNRYINILKEITGYKIALPQDEYIKSNWLCNMFKKIGVSTIYTCFDGAVSRKLYPLENIDFVHVLTGYVNEVSNIKQNLLPYKKRPIDIGYRARTIPFYLGKHGQLKTELATVFINELRGSEFTYDILNTTDSGKNVISGKNWFKFLANCKAVLGCEGGSDLIDPNGKIISCIKKYVSTHKNATFEEAEEHCFRENKNKLDAHAFSPRIFEAAQTKTLQLLVEGKYNGIVKPGVHYIEIKKDFSNVEEILNKLKDIEYCKKIIENSYADLIMSSKYSYRNFSSEMATYIKKNVTPQSLELSDRVKHTLVGFLISFNTCFTFLTNLVSFIAIKTVRYFYARN